MSSNQFAKARLARRYATALFELAQEKDALDAVQQDLDALTQTITAHEELRNALRNPVLSRVALAAVFEELAKKLDISDLTRQACLVMGSQRRLALLPEIKDAFNALLEDARGEMRAHITSAVTLSGDHKKSLTKVLGDMTKKKVHLEQDVDEAILGGLVIKLGAVMVDASIRGKLERLRLEQKKVSLTG